MKGNPRKAAAFALHRYFIWCNHMRTHFDSLLHRARGPEDIDEIQSFLYMSYWYAGLYVVIEGWKRMEIHDDEIDALLKSKNVELLRRYRNGAFHFQPTYFDDRFIGFMKTGEEAVTWVRTLNKAFARWFLQVFSPERLPVALRPKYDLVSKKAKKT